MKTKTLNLLFNPSNNTLLFEKFTNPMRKKVVLLFVFLFALTIANSFAQELRSGDETPQILELKSFLKTLKSSEQNARSSYSSSQNVEKLVYNVQPSIYVQSGPIKTYGEKPTNLFVDVNAMNRLSDSGLLKNNIEIVTIQISTSTDLNSVIDLSLLSNFKNLKYVHIVSSIATTQSSIVRMVQNQNEKYSVFFSITNGDTN